MDLKDFMGSKEYYKFYIENYLTINYFQNFVSLGFNNFNIKEKEKNCLTHSVFYDTDLMKR